MKKMTHTAVYETPFGEDRVIKIRETKRYWISVGGTRFKKTDGGVPHRITGEGIDLETIAEISEMGVSREELIQAIIKDCWEADPDDVCGPTWQTCRYCEKSYHEDGRKRRGRPIKSHKSDCIIVKISPELSKEDLEKVNPNFKAENEQKVS